MIRNLWRWCYFPSTEWVAEVAIQGKSIIFSGCFWWVGEIGVPANLEKYSQPHNKMIPFSTHESQLRCWVLTTVLGSFFAMSSGTNIWSLDDILKIGQLKWWFRKGVCSHDECRCLYWIACSSVGMFGGHLDPATGVLFPCCLESFWDVFYQRGTYLTCIIIYNKSRLSSSSTFVSSFVLLCAEVCVYAQGHQAVNSAALSVIINSLLWVHFSKKKTPSRSRLCCLVRVEVVLGKFVGRNCGFLKLSDHELNVDLWVTSKCY